MILTEDEKLLYDSCEEYVKRFIIEHDQNEAWKVWRIKCVGDDNILELCNQCPYYCLCNT